MKILTPLQVLAILEKGKFDRLIGMAETIDVECKGQIYPFQSSAQEMEFAKDMTSLANAGGGIIVMGLITKRPPASNTDEVEEIRPFDPSLVDVNRYEQVLTNWVYPEIESWKVRHHKTSSRSQKGLVSIFIPLQREEHKPFIVKKALLANKKISEAMFNVVTRRGAHSKWSTVESELVVPGIDN